MALGNARDNAPFDGFIGQLAWGPVADRTLRVGGSLTGQGHDLTPLLRTDRGPRRAETARHVGCIEALGQQEDHMRPETQVLGRFVSPYERVEHLALLL